MRTTLFIADLHLQENRPVLTQAFLTYLQDHAQQAACLYILGDLFEHWIGDDAIGAFEQRVAHALNDYARQGREVYFMPGNRDFLLGDAFAHQAGMTVLPDPTCITLDDQRILLAHGDAMCTQDQAYMQFRTQVRSSKWQQQVLAMPLTQRLALANQLREQSGEANAGKSAEIMDVTNSAVVHQMNTARVVTMIHGHTHRPAEHQVELSPSSAGRRLVLGDWREDEHCMWEARHDATGLRLQRVDWLS